jgi:probable F420-dependent oxidoreductase
VCLAELAAATSSAEIGVGVLLAALRHPLLLAKQLASVDALSGGRLVLGVGAGWMAEEFEIMDVPFGSRGERLDEWITLLRRCWTGEPGPFAGRHYSVPDGTFCYPVPARRIPVIIGGMSPAALRRAARADGWLALPRPSQDVVAVVRDGMTLVRAAARAAGRDLAGWRCILNAHLPQDVAPRLPELAALGVTDVVVDLDYDAPDGPRRAMDLLRAASR